MLSAELGRSEPGGTEQALRAAWEDAKEVADDGEAAVLLLEEVDCLGGGAAARRVGGQLQALLGGSSNRSDFKSCQSKVILVATTSTPELLSPALRRPGRLSTEESANDYKRIECINLCFSGVSHHSRRGPKTGHAEMPSQ